MATKPPSTSSKSPAAKNPTNKPPALKLPSQASKPQSPTHTAKTFAIAPWVGSHEGEKVVLYGKSGIGKTTLAAMAPNAVFIGLDDGGRKIHHPQTNEPVLAVPGILGFQDLRDALHQTSLWPADCTIVIDTVTKLEELLEPYVFQNYKGPKGATVTNMRGYGWDGPAHMLDCYRLLLTDLDTHIRAGRNVLLLAQLSQITVANAEGVDYLEDGPKLQHNKQYSTRTEICEWADHVIRVGYLDTQVLAGKDQKVGRVSGDATRAVFTGGAQHFIAKSRPVNGSRIPAVIGFETPSDDALWQFMFGGATVAEGGQ